MTYARNQGIWPRPVAPKPSDPVVGSGEVRQPDGQGEQPAAGVGAGPEPQPPPPGAFTAEGVLREALLKLWEQARAGGVDRIGELTIRMFEAGDGFRLLGAVGAVADAEKVVTINGGYGTSAGGTFQLEFSGPVTDAQPVREFLESQLRDAAERSLEVSFELTFAAGLPLAGDAAEQFTKRLARFAGGAAYVAATAAARQD